MPGRLSSPAVASRLAPLGRSEDRTPVPDLQRNRCRSPVLPTLHLRQGEAAQEKAGGEVSPCSR